MPKQVEKNFHDKVQQPISYGCHLFQHSCLKLYQKWLFCGVQGTSCSLLLKSFIQKKSIQILLRARTVLGVEATNVNTTDTILDCWELTVLVAGGHQLYKHIVRTIFPDGMILIHACHHHDHWNHNWVLAESQNHWIPFKVEEKKHWNLLTLVISDACLFPHVHDHFLMKPLK